MSVIIRLQNLPWSANAADIRAYFTALSIPEGGVHIVGGEQGDAFIAFSTDEDARQAMLRDGGKLKEVQIKLLLSSRTEMLRIIEQARQQTLNLQNIIQGTVTQPAAPVNQPIPNVAYETVESKDNMKEDDSDKGRDDDEYHRDRRDRRERDRSASRDRARSNEKDKSRDRDRERDRGRYNRDRDRDRRRRDRSKSRDRYRRRSRSRDRTRKTSRDKDSRNKRRDSEQDSDDKRATIEVPEPSTLQRWEPVLQSQSKPPLLPDPVLPQLLMQMQQGVKEMTPPIQPLIGFQDQDRRPMNFPQQMGQSMPYPGGPMRGRENWCGPMNNMSMPVMTSDGPAPRIPPNRHGLMPQNEMAIPKYSQAPYGMNQQFHPILKETNNHHWANQSMMQTNDDSESDICIEIRGLPLNATYVDVKRLFDGLTIPSDGIKMINDNQGNRTGIAYVKFSQQSHKKLALNQNGKKVRSSIVEVLHLREPIYNIAADNFKPEKDVMLKSDDMDIDNGDNSEEVAWKREGESIKVNYQDPRMINKSSKGSGKGNDSGRREQIKSDCVIIKGVHHSSTEADIIDFFSSLQIAPMEIYIVSDRMGQRVGDAFCKFMSPDEAEKALTKNKSTLGRHTVSVFSAPRDDMERAKSFCLEPHIPQYVPPPFMPVRGAYNPMQYKPRMPGEGMGNEYFMEGERPRMGFGNRFMMGDMERPPLMGRGDRPMMGRGRPMMPGMQNMRPPRRPPRSTSPYIDGDSLEHFGKPGCVVAMENIHFKADIDEIMEFFQGFKIEHEDVIRRFDESGRPTGDARVALKTPAEAMRAVRQLSFKTIRGRPIKVSIVQ